MRVPLATLLLVACGPAAPMNPGPKSPVASRSTLTVRPLTAVADGHDAVVAAVAALDADGQPAATTQVTFLVAGADAGSLVTDLGGHASQSLYSTVAGVKTVSAAFAFDGGSFTLDAASAVTFVPGPVSELRWAQQPSTVHAGMKMTPAVRASLFDQNGNSVTAVPKTMRVRLNNSTSGATLTGGDYRASVDGGLVWDMLIIDRAQSGCTLRAEEQGGGLASESAPFDVTP